MPLGQIKQTSSGGIQVDIGSNRWEIVPSLPVQLRRVVALVEVNGKDVEMAFMTNHLEWSAWSVTELYRCRWDIEVFFKEIKQTLQLSDFLGHSANAIRWQIWMGLLVHLLMRYLAFMHKWDHSFKRLFTVVRASPEQAYLPGFV